MSILGSVLRFQNLGLKAGNGNLEALNIPNEEESFLTVVVAYPLQEKTMYVSLKICNVKYIVPKLNS